MRIRIKHGLDLGARGRLRSREDDTLPHVPQVLVVLAWWVSNSDARARAYATSFPPREYVRELNWLERTHHAEGGPFHRSDFSGRPVVCRIAASGRRGRRHHGLWVGKL